MKHTINEPWDFVGEDTGDGGMTLYGVRWADGHVLLFRDMPEQQTKAYLKRRGVKDPLGHLEGKANN